MSQLPMLVFIPGMKCGFPEESDAAQRVHCHKPVLPALELVESPKTLSSAQEAASCLIFANVEMGRGRQ